MSVYVYEDGKLNKIAGNLDNSFAKNAEYADRAGVADRISGIIDIANGGTGATTSSNARNNLGFGSLLTYYGSVSGGTIAGDLNKYGVNINMTFNELYTSLPDVSYWMIYFNSQNNTLNSSMPVTTGGILEILKLANTRGEALFFDYRTGNLYTTPISENIDFKWTKVSDASKISGVLGISNGGTGGSTASQGRNNLGIHCNIYTGLEQINSSYNWSNFKVSNIPVGILNLVVDAASKDNAYASKMIPINTTGVLVIFAPVTRVSAIYIDTNYFNLYIGGCNSVSGDTLNWKLVYSGSSLLSTQNEIYSNSEEGKIVDALVYKQENLELTEYIADLMYEQSLSAIGL